MHPAEQAFLEELCRCGHPLDQLRYQFAALREKGLEPNALLVGGAAMYVIRSRTDAVFMMGRTPDTYGGLQLIRTSSPAQFELAYLPSQAGVRNDG